MSSDEPTLSRRQKALWVELLSPHVRKLALQSGAPALADDDAFVARVARAIAPLAQQDRYTEAERLTRAMIHSRLRFGSEGPHGQ